MEENEILESSPELPAAEGDPDMPGQSDPSPANPANDTPPANPVNTGLSGTPQDQENEKKDETIEEIPQENDEISSGISDQEQVEGDPDPGDEQETGDDSSVTNVTVIHPPTQQIIYQMDEETVYHMIIDNGEVHPVPVLVTGSLIEKDPGIMDKRLEDYTVTEAMLLLIWITLLIRMIFDYFGRRRS